MTPPKPETASEEIYDKLDEILEKANTKIQEPTSGGSARELKQWSYWIQRASFFGPAEPDREKIFSTLCRTEEQAKECIDKWHIDYYQLIPKSAFDAQSAQIERLERDVKDLHASTVTQQGKLITQEKTITDLRAALHKKENPTSVGVTHAVQFGGYMLIEKDYAGMSWMYGPDGDGFSMGTATREKLSKVLERFFKENM